MSPRCPACSTEIPHRELTTPREGVIYRCSTCRLELVFDAATGKMKIAPLPEPETERPQWGHPNARHSSHHGLIRRLRSWCVRDAHDRSSTGRRLSASWSSRNGTTSSSVDTAARSSIVIARDTFARSGKPNFARAAESGGSGTGQQFEASARTSMWKETRAISW